MNAPASRSKSLRQPGLIVYFCGLGTSALVLWGIRLLNERGENIMGWYANGIIPVGALIVGAASGLGYAIGSRLLNVKISRAFIIGMFMTALLDYVAAQWVTWSNLIDKHHVSGDRYTFWQYFRDSCEGMAFKRSSSSEAGSPLGMFGYFFKSLEMIGYAFGAMVPAAILRGMPYCHGCQYYLKKHQRSVISAPSSWAEIKKFSKPQRLEALQTAIQDVTVRAEEILVSVQYASFEETAARLSVLEKVASKDTPASVSFVLKKCPHCDAHHLVATLENRTVDKKAAQQVIANLDKTVVPVTSGEASAGLA